MEIEDKSSVGSDIKISGNKINQSEERELIKQNDTSEVPCNQTFYIRCPMFFSHFCVLIFYTLISLG